MSGLLQMVAYGAQDCYLPYDYSTTFNKKNRKFSGSRNFYDYVKNSTKNTTPNSSRRNIKNIKSPIYDNTTIDSCYGYINKFNDDKIYINKGIYFNNKRKYKNMELLFYYRKNDYYDYVSDYLKIFKTNP